jgi:hypothetical protein
MGEGVEKEKREEDDGEGLEMGFMVGSATPAAHETRASQVLDDLRSGGCNREDCDRGQ